MASLTKNQEKHRKVRKKALNKAHTAKIMMLVIIILIGIVAIFAAWDASLNTDLVRYWNFDENESVIARDYVNSDNMFVSSAHWNASGIINSSYSPNSESRATTYDVDTRKNFTINLWLMRTGTTGFTDGTNALFSNTPDNTNAGAGRVNWMSQSSAAIRMNANDDGSDNDFSFDTVLGVWNMTTIRMNDTAVAFFVDGEQEDAEAITNFDGLASDFYFFSDTAGNNKIGSVKIDEVGIWNRALSDTEISNLYNSGSGIGYPITQPTEWVFVDADFNGTGYETQNQGYVFNLTYNSSLFSSPTASLIYNGTSYSTTASIAGDNASFIRTLYPSGFGLKNLFWTFKFVNSTNTYYSNSSEYYQEISEINWRTCNASMTVPYLNISFKDEVDSSSINASISSSSWIYYLETVSNNKTYSLTNSTESPNYNFCFNPDDKSIYVNSYFVYASTGYPQRIWSETNTFTNSSTNKTLYLLSSDDGLYVTFLVVNAADSPLSDVYVNATTSIGGSQTLVASGYTDDSGSITFWLNPNNPHTFSFDKTGFDVLTTTITPASTSYTITLGVETSVVIYDYSKGISYSIQPFDEVLVPDVTYSFNYTLVSEYWDVSEFGFSLSNSSTVLSSTSQSSNGGVLNTDLGVGNNTEIIIDYYYIINSTVLNGSRYWMVYNVSGTDWSLKNFFDDISSFASDGVFGLNSFSLNVIIYLFIFVSIGIMSYKFGITSPATIAAVLVGLVWLFDVTLGLIPNPISRVPHFPLIFTIIVFFALFIREATK